MTDGNNVPILGPNIWKFIINWKDWLFFNIIEETNNYIEFNN